MSEIRAAFAQSESGAERLRNFRLQRVNDVMAQQTPVPLPESATVLVHVIPLNAFGSGVSSFDLSTSASDVFRLKPLFGTSVRDYWHNFDGIVAVSYPENHPTSYVQVFRSGALEAADTRILEEHQYQSEWVLAGEGPRPLPYTRLIHHQHFEKQIVLTVGSMLRFQLNRGVTPPVVLMLSLLRVSDYRIIIDDLVEDSHGHPIDRDVLMVPDLLLGSLDVEAFALAKIIRPVLDVVWNAAGYPRSHNFDQEGNWQQGFQ